MLAEDCEALDALLPPGAAPGRDVFLRDCTSMFRADPRAAEKRSDLAAWLVRIGAADVDGDHAVVHARMEGLSDRWSVPFRAVRVDGAWRLPDAFGPPMEAPAASPAPSGAVGAGDGMVDLPAGRFRVGCPARQEGVPCMPGDAPERDVAVGPLRLDRNEVNAGEWARCVAAGGCERALAVDGHARQGCNVGVPGREDHPANCVTYWGAVAYCEWAGKRLPTGIEWERAARGTAGRQFPWGDEAPDCTRAAMRGCGHDGTRPAGALPAGNTPEGVSDLSGNVDEWVASPPGIGAEIRGGAFDGEAWRTQPYRRRVLGQPYRLREVGFRCAK